MVLSSSIFYLVLDYLEIVTPIAASVENERFSFISGKKKMPTSVTA